MPTVKVEPVIGQNVIVVTWDRDPSPQDVTFAFRRVNRMLNDAPMPVYIVMDVLNNPILPLTLTIAAALEYIQLHPALAEWLIVGQNELVRMFERVVGSSSGRQNMRWFKSRLEADAYLAQHNNLPGSLQGTFHAPPGMC